MNCPICNQKVPFGLQMHLLAAHGPKRAEYQSCSLQMEKDISPNSGKRTYAKRSRGKPFRKKPLNHAFRSKLS